MKAVKADLRLRRRVVRVRRLLRGLLFEDALADVLPSDGRRLNLLATAVKRLRPFAASLTGEWRAVWVSAERRVAMK